MKKQQAQAVICLGLYVLTPRSCIRCSKVDGGACQNAASSVQLAPPTSAMPVPAAAAESTTTLDAEYDETASCVADLQST